MIGETGAEWLSIAIVGKTDPNGHSIPPLKKVDVNCCGLDNAGAVKIISAVASRPSIVFLDVSNNSVGPDIDQLLEKLRCCQLVEL
jgi:hypothetical protein